MGLNLSLAEETRNQDLNALSLRVPCTIRLLIRPLNEAGSVIVLLGRIALEDHRVKT